ncbi:MAG: hypothetical protein KIT36_06490 [Alphaproteobacteria bacterium]|nr:hypothetical protein [Alphaproteobacteria bacterium]
MKQLILVMLLGAGLATPAHACIAPREPFCLQIGQPDQWCAAEVRRYLKDERDYQECVARQAEHDMADSVARARKVVEKWNCRVAGQSLCL